VPTVTCFSPPRRARAAVKPQDLWTRGSQGGSATFLANEMEAAFPRSDALASARGARLTRAEVWTRLDALEVDSPTRNRYRTAASWLAKALVRHELGPGYSVFHRAGPRPGDAMLAASRARCGSLATRPA
jgi:hypothetical protein